MVYKRGHPNLVRWKMERRIIDLGEIVLAAVVHKEKQADSSVRYQSSSGFGIKGHTEVKMIHKAGTRQYLKV